MGSSLITTVCVMPYTLDAELVELAREKARKITAILAQDEYGSEELEPLGLDMYDVEMTFGYLEDMSELDVAELLEQFLTWYGAGASSRDTTTRPCPGLPDHQIVVSGASTWGDAPDGEGYEFMTKLSALGLLGVLGAL